DHQRPPTAEATCDRLGRERAERVSRALAGREQEVLEQPPAEVAIGVEEDRGRQGGGADRGGAFGDVRDPERLSSQTWIVDGRWWMVGAGFHYLPSTIHDLRFSTPLPRRTSHPRTARDRTSRCPAAFRRSRRISREC